MKDIHPSGRSLADSDLTIHRNRVIARAEEALGDPGKADRWLHKMNAVLGGARPIDLLDTDAGARMVERVLGRIEHGIYS
jgi:putative toxin-antitoxin system antitoxin component (TIGR02293 family)